MFKIRYKDGELINPKDYAIHGDEYIVNLQDFLDDMEANGAELVVSRDGRYWETPQELYKELEAKEESLLDMPTDYFP